MRRGLYSRAKSSSNIIKSQQIRSQILKLINNSTSTLFKNMKIAEKKAKTVEAKASDKGD